MDSASLRARIPSPLLDRTTPSTTFRPPPIDGSLSLLDICEWHREHSPEHPLFIFARPDGTTHPVTWANTVNAVHRGVSLIQDRLQISKSGGSTPVVAIVAQSETISYILTMLSIIRSNFIPFVVSPRNSPESVAHFLVTTNVQHVLVSGDAVCSNLVDRALAIVKHDKSRTVPPASPMFVFEDFFPGSVEAHVEDPTESVPFLRKNPEDIIIYLHSSGSTSHPKIIPFNNRKVVEIGHVPFYGGRDSMYSVMSMHGLPMFHSFANFVFMCTLTAGWTIACFQPQTPPVLPTANSVSAASKATNCDYLFSVPSICEEWSHRPEQVKWMAEKKGLIVGGGPLSKEAGDKLTAENIPVLLLYGMSEIGAVSCFPPKPPPKGDWEYFELSKQCKTELVPQFDGTYEAIIPPSLTCTPCLFNTKLDGVDAYTTSDLLVPHPTEAGYWKVFGRSDDQIIHANGEKTNPTPLEAILRKDPHIRSAILFGRGQFQVGALIEAETKEGPENVQEFHNTIWPTVEKMNAFAPQHSRLLKEMILIADPAKPFQYTAKGTVRRQAILKDYEEEIRKLYETLEASSQPEIPTPTHWDANSCMEFVRKVVKNVLPDQIEDDDDILWNGCDSLQASWIRNTILRGIRDTTKLDTRNMAWNLVYEHPTITKLAQYLLNVVTRKTFETNGTEVTSLVDSKVQAMRELAEKYSKDFPDSAGSAGRGTQTSKVVMLTGSTGALGSFILTDLILDEDVSRIYALNRGRGSDSEPLENRQRKAFRDRGLDENLLASDKLELLEGNILDDCFGLPSAVFQEMQRSVTHIIHNAWPVNFNLGLTSFEPVIKTLRGLLDFGIQCGSQFLFVSSVGVLSNASGSCTIPEIPTPPQTALSTGYAESKWVSEEIILRASRETKLHGVIARVGQVCGSSENGAWNTQEWAPALIQSSARLGCIPNDDRMVSWITPQMTAGAIVDFLNIPSTAKPGSVLHIRNPNPTPWSELARSIATELKVETVPYADWFKKLESRSSARDQEEIQALRILPFFRGLLDAGNSETREAFGVPFMDIQNALQASKTLSCGKGIDEADVKGWIAYWRKIGYV